MLDFRIWGHTVCGSRFWVRNCNFSNFVVYDPIFFFFISKCWKNNIKEGYITNIFGFEIICRTDLGDRDRFRGWKCNFSVYELIWSFYTTKCSQKNIKGCYLSLLGIRGHRKDLRDGGFYRGWKYNFGIYEPISKCSQQKI